MVKYLLKRFGMMLLTLFFIMTIGFFTLHTMPGSPYDDPELSAEERERLDAKLHLDEPVYVQYYLFLKGIVLDNNWGVSIKLRPGVDAFTILMERIPVSLRLNVLSLLISIPLGIIGGTIAALSKNKWPDYLISLMVILFISVPSFVFASTMQYFLSGKLGWFPIIYDSQHGLAEQYYSMVLPVLALSFGPIASITRYLRGELIENLSSEYMLLARTKGLRKYRAVVRHAFRNSMVPLANVIIPMLTHIMGGSLVVETVFSIPGIGGILTTSINAHDYSLAMSAMLFYSVISVVTIFIVDISYGIIDPRIRLGAKKNG